MNVSEQKRFDALYVQHLRALKLHGYSDATIDGYSRAVRRLAEYYDCVPDQLSTEQLEPHSRTAFLPSTTWSMAYPSPRGGVNHGTGPHHRTIPARLSIPL